MLGKIVAFRDRPKVKRQIDAPGRSLVGFPLLFLTGVDRVRQNRDLGGFRGNLPQELQSLACKFGREERYPGDIPAGPRETDGEPPTRRGLRSPP